MADKLGYRLPETGQSTANVSEAPLIPAATVVVIRDGSDGIETLMLRRNASGRFGGMWVFPGGRIDPEDLDGRATAVRETREEAGIDLDPDALVTLSRWTPPPYPGKRFDTQFFVAGVDYHERYGVQVDGNEILEHDWMQPSDAIARRDARELDLAPPTFVTLKFLGEHTHIASAVAAAAAQQTIPHFATRPVNHGEGSLLMWFEDAGYSLSDPEAAISVEGPRHRLHIGDGLWRYERTVPW